MKTHYLYCGLDVHKDTVFACALDEGGQKEIEQFGTMTCDLESLKEWLEERSVGQVAMESTSIYWYPIWRMLEDDFQLTLVNPFFIKQMPGRKTDMKDAEWIATLLSKGMMRGSLIPNKLIRILRDYERRYVYLQGRLCSCLQELERLLIKCNIRISSLTSNIEAGSVMKVVERLIEGEKDPSVLLKEVHGRVRNRHKERVREALRGFVDEHDRFLLEQAKDDYEHFTTQAEALQKQMEQLCDTYYHEEMELLCTIPGVQRKAAMAIIAETGGDMDAFQTPERLVSWTGLRPRNDESAGKIKSKRTTHGNKYLRRILLQTAWGVSHSKSAFLSKKYQELLKRKSAKKAIVAIARKQEIIIWHVLSKKEPYREPRLKKDAQKTARQLAYHKRCIAQLEAQQAK